MPPKRYPQQDYSRPAGAIEIILVRHGASEAAVEDQPFELLEGQADPPLSAHGERQAQAVAAHLANEPLTGLFVTSLRRTAQTERRGAGDLSACRYIDSATSRFVDKSPGIAGPPGPGECAVTDGARLASASLGGSAVTG